MKKLAVLMILLIIPSSLAQESEENAGMIGPEDGILHGLDRMADNIKIFLSRIGGEETHANTVRRVVAERRAEHLRLLRLKQDGELTGQEFGQMVAKLNQDISMKENALEMARQRASQKAGNREGGESQRPTGSDSELPGSPGKPPNLPGRPDNLPGRN